MHCVADLNQSFLDLFEILVQSEIENVGDGNVIKIGA